jgi:peptide deformylase
MAARKIRLLGDPVLRKKCRLVKRYSSPVVRRTIRDLRDTLDDFRSRHGFGRGIAAPQIGAAFKIIFIRTHHLGPLINPKITKRSKRTFKVWDDCFSFPDLLVEVNRHAVIEVAYRDANGAGRKLRATNGLSELLQHEIDHTNGVLAIDRAISSRSIVMRSEFKKPA